MENNERINQLEAIGIARLKATQQHKVSLFVVFVWCQVLITTYSEQETSCDGK